MRFRVSHLTRYTYTKPVFIEPQTIRLVPRCDRSQRLVRFSAHLTPEPLGRTEGLDAEGNSFILVWFEGLWESLEIRTDFEVETARSNPFDYLPGPGMKQLPLVFGEEERLALFPFLDTGSGSDPAVSGLAQEIAGAVSGDPMAFLNALVSRINADIRSIRREEPGLFEPGEVLAGKEGACRDMTVLFIAVCRAVGIPARFVSGYQEGDPDEKQSDLHAWAEVYLPGGGWRGYDPTLGLAVADRHVALAAGASPSLASPVTGTIRGTGAESAQEHHIRLVAMQGESA